MVNAGSVISRTEGRSTRPLRPLCRSQAKYVGRRQQLAIFEPCIRDLVAHGGKNEDWWKQHLGLAVQQSTPSATEYWTWSPEYQNYYHLRNDGTYEWAAKAGSSTVQQSSSGRNSVGRFEDSSSRSDKVREVCCWSQGMPLRFMSGSFQFEVFQERNSTGTSSSIGVENYPTSSII
jgi:hypothetical protein